MGFCQHIRISVTLVAVFSSTLLSSTVSPAQAASDDVAEETEGTAVEAEEASENAVVSPWTEGVPKDAQANALSLFKRGNALLEDRKFEAAMPLFTEALESWKHPAIYFSLVVCEVNLAKPLEAYEHVKASLAYGEAPLGEEIYGQALTYEKLLEGQVGRLRVSTEHDDVSVTLDGQPLMDGPGELEKLLLPGHHQIVARKKDYVTYTRAVTVVSGEPTILEIKMVSLVEATEYKRPMDQWVPWAVAGAGAVVALAGGGMMVLSSSKYDEYNRSFPDSCPSGCTDAEPPVRLDNGEAATDLNDLENEANTWKVAGIATLAAGGAALVTGVTLMILNSPKPIRPLETPPGAEPPTVGPTADLAGARVDFKFHF